jgi:hypothetical protein
MKWSKAKKPVPPAEAPGFNILVTDPTSGKELLKIRVPSTRAVPESEIRDTVAQILATAGVLVRSWRGPVAIKSILDELGVPITATEEQVRGAILALKYPHPDDSVPREDYDA